MTEEWEDEEKEEMEGGEEGRGEKEGEEIEEKEGREEGGMTSRRKSATLGGSGGPARKKGGREGRRDGAVVV